MSTIRSSFHILLLLAVVASIPMLALATLVAGAEVNRARELYEVSKKDLLETRERLALVESGLRQMTTSIAAVEWEARHQHRLIKSGERLILVERQ